MQNFHQELRARAGGVVHEFCQVRDPGAHRRPYRDGHLLRVLLGNMRKSETHLEMARRQVAEAENRIARQLKVIDRLSAGGHDTSGSEQLLASHREFLRLAQRQLEIAKKAAGAAQDGAGEHG